MLSIALAIASPCCGDDAQPDDRGARPVDTERLTEEDGTALAYRMEDRWGDVPPMAAQLHLVDVLDARLAAIGQDRAALSVGSKGELRVIVADDARDAAAATIEQTVELRFRIRAPSDIENPERDQRTELGEFYEESLPDFAWFGLGNGEQVLLYVPEVPRILELEALRAADPVDESAVRERMQSLQKLLLQKVFTGADLSDAQAIHRPGDSSVRVTIRPDRRAAFREFTAHYRTRQMAILLDGVVIAAPTLSEPLESAAEIRKPGGSFSPEEAESLAATLRRTAYGIRLTRLR